VGRIICSLGIFISSSGTNAKGWFTSGDNVLRGRTWFRTVARELEQDEKFGAKLVHVTGVTVEAVEI
jgi:hypothetical protein